VIDVELLVKTRTNTCLSYTSAVPSYSVVWTTKNELTPIEGRPKLITSRGGLGSRFTIENSLLVASCFCYR
jgi:hypothetical protein